MLLDQLQNDLKDAQLDRDQIKTSTLRLLLSEIRNAEITKGGFLSESDVIALIQGEIKKRKEAALGFRQGGREESAQKEEAELKILAVYLPSQPFGSEPQGRRLANDQLTKIVTRAINEVGAKTLADMGKVMGVVMSKVSGRADGGTVSALVKERLSHD